MSGRSNRVGTMRWKGCLLGLAGLTLGGLAAAGDAEAPRPGLAWTVAAAEGAYLGVHIEEEVEYPEGGARVTRVVQDSPAARAGLETGDVIVGFDGQTIRGPVALTRQIHAKQGGDVVAVRVLRRGAERALEVELVDRRRSRLFGAPAGDGGDFFVMPEIAPVDVEELREKLRDLDILRLPALAPSFCVGGDCEDLPLLWNGRPKLGVELVSTTPELRVHLGGDEDSGVLIGKVLRGTPAEAAGVLVGDLLVSVAGKAVADVDDIRRALIDRDGEAVRVEVIRAGERVVLEARLPEIETERPTGPRA